MWREFFFADYNKSWLFQNEESQTEGRVRAEGKQKFLHLGHSGQEGGSWFGVRTYFGLRRGDKQQKIGSLRGQAAIQAAWRKTNRVTFFAKVQEWGNGRTVDERTDATDE